MQNINSFEKILWPSPHEGKGQSIFDFFKLIKQEPFEGFHQSLQGTPECLTKEHRCL